MEPITLGLAVWLVMGAVVGMIAHAKGRSAGLWFLYGALIWPIALTHALVMPWGATTARAPCPSCKELAHRDATVCPHCRSELPHGWAPRPRPDDAYWARRMQESPNAQWTQRIRP